MKAGGFALLVLAGWSLVRPAGAVESADQRFVAGLVQRRLFALADAECRRLLSREELSLRDRVEWTVELIRIRGQHAAHAAPGARAGQWQAAHAAAAEFLTRWPDHPRRIVVQVQDALTTLAEGELARWESEVAAEPQAALEQARVSIRQATRELEELDKQLATDIASHRADRESADAFSSDELFGLQNHVRFQLARALRNQALCYAAGSDDRVAALVQAVTQLNRTLRQLRHPDPLVWQVALDLAACQRLLGDGEQARLALDAPLSDAAPAAIRLRAWAEIAELAIAAGDPQQALDVVKQAQDAHRELVPELDFARLQALLTLWQSTLDGADSDAALGWQEQSTAAVKRVEQLHGAYWGRRAELELLRVAGSGTSGSSVEILGRTAANLYLKEQYDEAIVTYERAAQQARVVADQASVHDMEYKAAAIEQHLQRHTAASRRLERLALEMPDHPEAAATHLLAVWNEAQAVRELPRDGRDLTRYENLLAQQLQRWPDQPPTSTARVWLGQLRSTQQQWEAAVDAYRDVPPDADEFAAMLPDLARCWARWIDRQQDQGESAGALVTESLQFFDRIILGADGQWPAQWTAAQRAAALATARLRLEFVRDGCADAERALRAALDQAPASDDSWRASAQSLLVVALAGQPGRAEQAQALLEELGSGSPDRLLDVAQGLSQIVSLSPGEVQQQLAALQLAAVEHLLAGSVTLEPAQRVRIDLLRAESLRTLGRHPDALQVYRDLAAGAPDDRDIQVRYGQVLLESDGPAELSEAVAQWQKITRRLRPHTDDWYHAKYSFALALFRRNQGQDRQVAGQQLRYLKATSQVDQSTWQTQVDELLQQCPP
jgi:tetratricopeptide (TPR) repeat protein